MQVSADSSADLRPQLQVLNARNENIAEDLRAAHHGAVPDARAPLRILYVHNSADIYGASRSLLRLLGALNRAKFSPLVLLPEDGPLRPLIESHQIEVVIHPGLSVINRQVFHSWRLLWFFAQFPASVIFLWRLIRRQQIDLVHTNTGVILSPALSARLAGVPHVWHVRDWFQEFRRFWPWYARYMTGCSARAIAVSEAIAAQFPRRDKVMVVHNGFSLEEFAVPRDAYAQEFRQRLKMENEFVVGCVGRIKLVRKGQEVLIHAAALLAQKNKHVKFVIVGSPAPGSEDHLDKLKALARELRVEDRVVFTGEISDTRMVYPALDVFVLPSAQPEPFGGVVMEAMAMGVPVIATNIGGSLDQVAEGETGFLVPPADPQALAEKIMLLIDNAALRSRMSAAGPRRIGEKFSLTQMVNRFEKLYEELAAERRARFTGY